LEIHLCYNGFGGQFRAARRELLEELNLDIKDLKPVAHFYMDEPASDTTLHQFNMLFEARYDGPIEKFQEAELSGGKWFTPDEIKKMIKEKPSDFAPGFKKAWEEYNKNNDHAL